MSLPLLLEIGTEEIPDWMIEPALGHLQALFQELLEQNRLKAESVKTDATPRRLVLRAEGLPERQPDAEELISGPPASAAFKDGQPTGAALGFARKMGVDVADLTIQNTPRGEYLCYLKRTAGRATRDILAEGLPQTILGIHFPKTMYWTGKGGPRFIRPIRWLVALLGAEVVPFEVAGVKSGDRTSGHRVLGQQGIAVSTADYEQALKANFVLLSAQERRRKIESEIEALLQGTGLKVRPDPALLNTLVYITEYPTPILGSFDPEFLKLPEEVLVTVMRHHQKYFSMEEADGRLAPRFIAVMNTNSDAEGLVRHGNERVLRARFNDARFFWSVDQQKKLEDRVPDLAYVTFQAKLGSYLDKTRRIVKLSRRLAKLAGVESAAVERAALLSKCDLTTEMVKELTELQGVMGGLYARAQGEPEEIWRAIYEQYKPVGMEDSIPSTATGRILALADKVDTLVGCFRVGLIPSGSKDPFALRRAAQGVVKILVEGKLSLPLSKLIGKDQALMEFFLDRVRYYFREVRGFRYDEVNAVLAAGCEDLTDVESRLEAIQAVRPTENFEPLAASFKRIKNILKQAEFAGGGVPDATLLEQGPEADLYSAFQALRSRVKRLRKKREYRTALEAIASLRPQVDSFFDRVLVNAPEPDIRLNRLTLLHNLLSEFSAIADFSEIVTTLADARGPAASPGTRP
ncbi:MAG TPA: glycine--tRNA ligase subunit beta [Bryobacteraceae bacterium]|nr:glycine--tRNA ligase subunit beta [Bryobacteraceae bacterium]HOQ47153.1 glycine--tRNA ligase subunit beta [Bryobacteraceae bacterium]HPU72520.1 glycine--tRNA ligase subunit beta [Bryobacteraceae bacterium]